MRRLARMALVAAAVLAMVGLTASAAAAAPQTKTITAYVTGYSYYDNTPPGSPEISHPVIHSVAGGNGTFSNPITVAVGHSIVKGRDILDWPAGTKFYVPKLRRYLIVEDTCGDGPKPQNGPCHRGFKAPASTWLDVWVDGRSGSSRAADRCMDKITGNTSVIVNPASNLPVTVGPIANKRCA